MNRVRQAHRSRAICLPAIIVVILAGLVGHTLLAENEPKANSATRTDQKGRKFVNKIPYDVFFDRPLDLLKNDASNQAPILANKLASDQSSPPNSDSKSTGTANKTKSFGGGSSAGSIVWNEFLPLDELQNEIKSVRGNLTKATSSQGQYNQQFKQIAVDGAEIAALAAIARQHSDSISWKEKAHYVREFGSQINKSANGLGKENFERTKLAVQRLTSALDGSVPPDAGDIAPDQSFHECATRKGLMKRIEKSRDWMKSEINSEARFKSKIDQVRHEAAILSALTTVISQPGYDYTENSDYQSFARSLIEAARDAGHACDDGSYTQFKSAFDKVNKSCTDCHGSYGNG